MGTLRQFYFLFLFFMPKNVGGLKTSANFLKRRVKTSKKLQKILKTSKNGTFFVVILTIPTIMGFKIDLLVTETYY